jgi:hypothetical protein
MSAHLSSLALIAKRGASGALGDQKVQSEAAITGLCWIAAIHCAACRKWLLRTPPRLEEATVTLRLLWKTAPALDLPCDAPGAPAQDFSCPLGVVDDALLPDAMMSMLNALEDAILRRLSERP